MRHRNNVKQLGRTSSHRDAMFGNMIASFYLKESIITTKQKAKELKKISEKLITRAIKNTELKDTDVGKKLHNKRIVLKFVKDEDAVKKLFDDIAPRFATRKGGYTRIYLLGRRPGDAAEMALIELVDRKISKPVKEKDTDKKVAKPAKEKDTEKKVAKSAKGKDTEKKIAKPAKEKDAEKKVAKSAKEKDTDKKVAKPAKEKDTEKKVAKPAKGKDTEAKAKKDKKEKKEKKDKKEK